MPAAILGRRGRAHPQRGDRGADGVATERGSRPRPTRDLGQHRPERPRPRDRSVGHVRGPGHHDEPPGRPGVRHRHPDHTVRVHRRRRHALRDGRGERASGRDPRRPGTGGPFAWARPTRGRDRDGGVDPVRDRGVDPVAVARLDVQRPARRGRTRVPRGRGHGAGLRARVHLHGGDPRVEDHAVHALLAVDRATDRLDRVHAGDVGGVLVHGVGRLGRVRRLVGARAGDRLVRVGEGAGGYPTPRRARGSRRSARARSFGSARSGLRRRCSAS